MRTTDYLAAVRAKVGARSDYALIPVLGITRQTMTNYRQGRTGFDDRIALRVAELLEIDPARILADMQAERATSEQVRAIWQRIASGIAAALAVGAFGLSAVAVPAPSQAATKAAPSVDYVNRRRRRSVGDAFASAAAELLSGGAAQGHYRRPAAV